MNDVVVVDREGIEGIIAALVSEGYRTLGPTVRDGSVQIAEVRSADDLPVGWHDTQTPGHYQLVHTDDRSLFGWAVGADSIKADVFPSHSVLWRAEVSGTDVAFEEIRDETPDVALVGVRPCETAALEVLDRVLGGLPAPDTRYTGRRARFVLTAECGFPSGTCFCTSMDTGPDATRSFDLAITELNDPAGHRFLVKVGTELGRQVLSRVSTRSAEEADLTAREELLERARSRMGRRLETSGLPDLLSRNLEHPRWDDVAERCLACGNCTLVCPTCFCATVQDTTDIHGTVSRERSWSSCFDIAHSYLHGGPVRESTRSRYRQWMTHKLSTWWDQFGTSGCVGCGRCITWCPVGIDITEEAAVIRQTDGAQRFDRSVT